MRQRILVFTILALVLLAVAPRAAPAGDTEEAAAAVVESLAGAAARLAELAKLQIQAGRTDDARGTLDLLDRVLDLKSEVVDVLGRAAPAALPKARVEEPRDPATLWFGSRGDRKETATWGAPAGVATAIEGGLAWLAAHQSPDGSWDADGFMKEDKVAPISDGAGHATYDVGVSGLALLAFLGDGQTHEQGDHRETVRRGLAWLMGQQDEEGCFGPRTTNHFTYGHAIATQALCEAYALADSAFLKKSAQKGLDFILHCQNPYLAWRYGVRPGDNDTSVTSWMVAALHAGKMAGLRVDPADFEGAQAWLDKATEPEYGRVGYTSRGTGPARPQDLMDKFPADKSESLTAAGIFLRVMIGEDPRKSEPIQKGVDLCLKVLPVWDEVSGAIDMYFWYWGSAALFQVGGDAWQSWNGALRGALIGHQRRGEPSFEGSWDPLGPWGADGGRVYSTALCTMMLESPYRYGRLFDIPSRTGGLREFK